MWRRASARLSPHLVEIRRCTVIPRYGRRMHDVRDYRRNLPHYQNANRTYLVTFVTYGRWILPPVARDVTIAEVSNIHESEAFVHAAVVMPDHVHCVMQPLLDNAGITIALPVILRKLKGRSARFINLALGRRGHVWLNESHDHQLRSEESLMEKIDYVLQNPVRKGLTKTPDDYRWIWRWWIEGNKQTG